MAIELKRAPVEYLDVTGPDGTRYPRSLQYRPPTTKEALAYNRGLYNFDHLDKDGRPEVNQEFMVDQGLALIVGWHADLFTVDGSPVSPDPAAPNYCPEWQTILREALPQMLIQVATRAYGSVLVEKSHPFPKS